MLAGDLGAEGLTEQVITGPSAPRMRQALPNVPKFRAAGSSPESWIKADGGKPLAFRTSGQQRDVALMPLSSLFDRRYSVYWQVS